MITWQCFAVTVVAGLFTFTASAQNIKPGLWEMTSAVQGQAGGKDVAGAQVQAQRELASLPPEQRKMVEAMMAKQGVAMKTGGANAVRICISKEMAERNQLPARQEGDCKTEWSPRAGNSVKTKFACTNPPSTGTGEITFSGSEAYTMNMAMTQTRGGKPETMTMQSSGKWLGADCGGLKPMPVPAR